MSVLFDCPWLCAARTQEEGLRRVQELKAEISSLEESRKSEKEAFGKLKEEHDALTKQLEEEKVILLINLIHFHSNKLIFLGLFDLMFLILNQ